MKLALKKAENADLTLIVLEPKSVDFVEFLSNFGSKKSIIVINKMDLGLELINSEIKKYVSIQVSIKKEKNLDKLIYLIKESLKNKFISSEDIYITRERHRSNLKNCLEHLKNFVFFHLSYF